MGDWMMSLFAQQDLPFPANVDFERVGVFTFMALIITSLITGWLVPRYVYREKIDENSALKAEMKRKDELLQKSHDVLLESLATGRSALSVANQTIRGQQ